MLIRCARVVDYKDEILTVYLVIFFGISEASPMPQSSPHLNMNLFLQCAQFNASISSPPYQHLRFPPFPHPDSNQQQTPHPYAPVDPLSIFPFAHPIP